MMKKRIAALALCVLMTLTLMPLSSSAQNVDSRAIPADANMETDKIGIGMNLFYYCDAQYKYTTDNGYTFYATSSSYHTYPNEPATLVHVVVRATNEGQGWGITGDYGSRLKGNVKDYVKPEFFTSPDTVKAANGTIGIADPTGEKVKAMLTLTEEDYQAIVEEWIEWARTSGFNGNGYYDNWNWAVCAVQDRIWDTVDPADYKAVPYVLKFQGDHVWFIDMIILPRAKYTLGYDRNLDHGYTLPSNTKFPETATYDEGAIAQIVGNPNVRPSRTVDGKTEYATFMYWVDEYGNKYGDGYTMSIPMVEDKVLYAMWDYDHDPQFGSLRVNKKVTNLHDNVISPPDTTFNITVAFAGADKKPLTEEYAYKVYDASSAVMSQGVISSGGTIGLQDRWYVIIDHLPKDSVCTVDEKAPEHYRALRMPKTDTIVAGNAIRILVENVYARIPVTEAWYTVEHYFQDENGEYPTGPDLLDIEIVQLNAGNNPPVMTNAQPKHYEPFTLDAVRHPNNTIETKEVAIDGSTVIPIYYARPKYPYQVRYLEKDTNEELLPPVVGEPLLYGGTAAATAPAIPGYTLVSAQQQSLTIREETDANENGTIDSGEIQNNIITFYYTQHQVTIRYQVVGEDGCGTVSRSAETVKVWTGEPAGSVPSASEGYVFSGWFLDEDCTQPVKESWVSEDHILPQKDRTSEEPYVPATYYAQFQRIKGNLTITRANASDPEQVFVYQVVNTADNISITVTVVGNGSVTICDVPYGSYTVTQLNDWSWRHDDPAQTVKTDGEGNAAVTFDDALTDDQWLDGNSPQIDNKKQGGSAE